MNLTFPSPEWVAAFQDAVNDNDAYEVAAKKWTFGEVALIVKALPDSGLEHDVGIWLDLHQGVCRESDLVTVEKAHGAPFCITGEYGRWKQVIRRELDPIKGMMQGKLKLKGNLPIIVRFVRASQELVLSAGNVPTSFVDE